MATGTRLMQEINDQFLHCKICFENFRDPKTLSCLHTFCCACLQQQYDQEISSRSTKFSIYSRQVTCPLCRKKTDLPTGGVRRLPDNFLVSNLTEVLAKRTVSKIPPCEICSSVRAKTVDACSKCLDCTKLLCKGCVELHLATKVTQQHSLIDLEGQKDIECKVHPEENVRFYCEPCDSCICVVCAFQEHKDHEVCSLSDGSHKHRSSLEAILGRCKERLLDVSMRLNAIEKYETVVKDIKERIRDLAISYIAQVRAKEKELMKCIEDEYGGEIKDFVDHKRSLQESLDELQSTCNLTDIMLRDKGVELLLIRKDMEGKMLQLLEFSLPGVPPEPRYDVRFVPGVVALGRLLFGKADDVQCNDDLDDKLIKNSIQLRQSNQSNGCVSFQHPINAEIISSKTPTEKCRSKDMATSMHADMRVGYSDTSIQTEGKSLVSRDTSTKQVETRERGVIARVYDTKSRGIMTERSDVRSLKCQTDQVQINELTEVLPRGFSVSKITVISPETITPAQSAAHGQPFVTSAATTVKDKEFVDVRRKPNTSIDRPSVPDLLPIAISPYTYTPGRRIRSIKIQTEISTLDMEYAASSTDRQFVNIMLHSQQASELSRQEKEITSTASRLRERPRRVRTVDAGCMTVHHVRIVPETTDKETSPETVQHKDAGTHVVSDAVHVDTQTVSPQYDDSSTSTDREGQAEKSTSTQSVSVTDQETCTPIVTSESKVTWTEKIATSERSTCTSGPKVQDRGIGTLPVKTADIGAQIKPYVNSMPTNTPTISSSDHECQTFVDTCEQGTIPDAKIEKMFADIEKAEAEAKMLDSSVDFETPPQSPLKLQVETCDRATDAFKMPSYSKATETIRIKCVSSSTETTSVKTLDKDTATTTTKTIDQWTETPVPQLINTGVTPPTPATLDVGVATNVVLTDEQATCTDVKAYRDTHTETVLVICHSETLTELTQYADAQTSAEPQTENRECETDKLNLKDEGSITDSYNLWEAVETESRSTQSDTPILRTKETNTSQHRKKAKEIQTEVLVVQCPFCGRLNHEDEEGIEPGSSAKHGPLSSRKLKDSSTMPHSIFTQDVGTMAISCIACYHEFQETAIQTSHPKLYDKASATSFDLDPEFLERALSREYQDAATSTESLPYIGLLSEIDVDDLIVVPEAAFELVSDTDSEHDLIMVDDETSTDFVQYVEVATQTFIPSEDASIITSSSSMTESTCSKDVGEVVRSVLQNEGARREGMMDCFESKHFVSIGINTAPKLTFEKETCTPISHLFSKGTMTFYVSKMDKSTSTLNQARIITGSTLTKTKSVDKITMTAMPEKRDIGVETVATPMEGKITECISKLRNVSQRLNSPPAKREGDIFFGRNFGVSKLGPDSSDQASSPMSTSGASSSDKPEEERQRQLKTLLEQTNALLKPKDRSPIRKPQPITTLKGRKPTSINPGVSRTLNLTTESTNTLIPGESNYTSKSLPREFASERPGTVRMGSQPLPPSRLPLLRYNSAPGRIATVPTQTLLKKSGQATPKLSRSVSPRISPSKIPITKKQSPPDYIERLKPQPAQLQQEQGSVDNRASDVTGVLPQLRRPLPSITETRTPSSCSDSSTASHVSAGSNTSAGMSVSSNQVSTDFTLPANRFSTASSTIEPSSPTRASNRLSLDSATTTPSPSPSMTTSFSITSESLSDNVFQKSLTDTIKSTGSTETLEDKSTGEDKPCKKSGIGFMQRLLSRKKKTPESKKEPIHLLKSGPPTAAAVAALATAGPPLPAPPPESMAHVQIQHPPPHQYPPLVESKEPQTPRKPRPCVYLQQRLVPIQQDNFEDMTERKERAEVNTTSSENQPKNKTSSGGGKEKDRIMDRQKEREKSTKEDKFKVERSKKEEKSKADREKEKEKLKRAEKEERAKAEREKEEQKRAEKEEKAQSKMAKSKKSKANVARK